MKNQKIFDAITKHELTADFLAETDLTNAEQKKLEQLATLDYPGVNSLMIACDKQHDAVAPLCKLISQLPQTQQEQIVLQKASFPNIYQPPRNAIYILFTSSEDGKGEADTFNSMCQLLKKGIDEDKQLETVAQTLQAMCSGIYLCRFEIFCNYISSLNSKYITEIISTDNLSEDHFLMLAGRCAHFVSELSKLMLILPEEIRIQLVSGEPSFIKTAIIKSYLEVNYQDDDPIKAVAAMCELINSVPVEHHITLLAPLTGYSPFHYLPGIVCANRNPMGRTRSKYGPDGEAVAREFFDGVIMPFLEIMKTFPLDAKVRVYEKINDSMPYLYDDEKARIRDAIGVHRPFNPKQQIAFGLAMGLTIPSAAVWLLITTGVVTNATFATIAWPITLALAVLGSATMIGLSCYASYFNPPQLCTTEEKRPLIESKKVC